MTTQIRTGETSVKKKFAGKKKVCEETSSRASEKEAFLYTAKVNAAKMFSKYL